MQTYQLAGNDEASRLARDNRGPMAVVVKPAHKSKVTIITTTTTVTKIKQTSRVSKNCRPTSLLAMTRPAGWQGITGTNGSGR